MRCPVDEEVLQISERQGVEIDYCPRCRGVWLDRGELDKILDRVDRDDDDDRRVDRSRGDRDDRPYRKKKKSSFLSEIFEMGG